MSDETQMRIRALGNFLNVETEIIDTHGHAEDLFSVLDQTFLVLTDEEADEHAFAMIEADLTRLPDSTLLKYAKKGVTKKMLDMVKNQDSNTVMGKLIGDMDSLVEDQLLLKGRGYYIAQDSEENEEGAYYIYRLN